MNAAEITYKQMDIKIENSSSVIINTIRMVSLEENPQFIILQNVTNFYLTGQIYCSGCSDIQGPLHLQLHNVEHAVLEDVNSTVPMKMTTRHLTSLSIYRTYIAQLPWPGIFVYNATRVSISYSILPGLYPKSISMTLGKSVDVSYNIMDIENSLNVQQFDNVNEQCNRLSKLEELSFDCKRALVEKDFLEPYGRVGPIRLPEPSTTPLPPPPLLELTEKSANDDLDYGLVLDEEESIFNLTYVTYAFDYAKDYMQEWRNDTIAVTALTHNGVYGIVFLTVSIICAVIFALIYCCCRCCCKPRKEEPEQQFLERQLSSHLDHINTRGGRKLEDGDEYSISSKAHLSQGIDDNGLEPVHRYPSYTQYPSLQYVTVRRVQTDADEDGVICGSLTLTPSSTVNNEETMRDVSSNQLKAQAFNKNIV